MLRRFDCPDCGKFLGRTDGTSLETKCAKCMKIVEAVPLALQLTLECVVCGRRRSYERPAARPRVCVACGSQSLTPVEFPTPLRPAEALQTEMVSSGRQSLRTT